MARVALAVPDPSDYFAGSNALPSALPTNVLQFCRRDARQLAGGEALHHRFVLIAALEASGCVVVDGSAIWLGKGEGVLVFPFQGHHFTRFTESARVSWLFTTFEYARLEELEPLRDTAFSYSTSDIGLLRQLTEISALKSANSRQPTTVSPILLAHLINGLLREQHLHIADASSTPAHHTADLPFISAVSLYIHRHLNENITPDDIAEEIHLSTSRLRAKFKQLMGMSLGHYISEARIHKARSLLHSTHLNVTQIAESCGYESVFSFSRAFKRITGSSPTHFAKTSRQQE